MIRRFGQNPSSVANNEKEYDQVVRIEKARRSDGYIYRKFGTFNNRCYIFLKNSSWGLGGLGGFGVESPPQKDFFKNI